MNVSGEGYLLVESTADGWWYTAPLPPAGMVGMLMTDADLCRLGGLARGTRWHDRLRSAGATMARVHGMRPQSAPRAHAARSHRLVRSGSGDMRPWLAVGDAALAVDPISGSGVLRALRTADAAATTAVAMLDKPGRAGTLVAAYEAARNAECTASLRERAAVYGMVRRYGTPFWSRRARRLASDVAVGTALSPAARDLLTRWSTKVTKPGGTTQVRHLRTHPADAPASPRQAAPSSQPGHAPRRAGAEPR